MSGRNHRVLPAPNRTTGESTANTSRDPLSPLPDVHSAVDSSAMAASQAARRLIFTNIVSRCHCHCGPECKRLACFQWISMANNGPKRCHQNRTDPWLMSMLTLVQQVLDVAGREREAHVHHRHQADDLAARLEVLERVRFRHHETMLRVLTRRKLSSDTAAW